MYYYVYSCTSIPILKQQALFDNNTIRAGYKIKTRQMGLTEEMDAMGIRMLNFVAEFWDMKEQYALLHPSRERRSSSEPSFARPPGRPSCSVIFKHLPDKGEVLMGHNTWHEYRAMSFR